MKINTSPTITVIITTITTCTIIAILASILPSNDNIFSLSSITAYGKSTTSSDKKGEVDRPDFIIRTSSNNYRIEVDYETFFDDVLGKVINKNKGAKDVHNPVLKTGENIRMGFAGDGGGYEDVTVFLVSRSISDKRIVSVGV